MKKTWTILNQALNKTNNKPRPDSFNINSEYLTDKAKIATEFNKYFAEIGETISNNVTKTGTKYSNFLKHKIPHSFFFIPTDPGEILKITNKLKMKSSQGFDNLSTKLLKSTIDEILIPLTHIINLSMQSGTVPEKMKITKIIPIYKSGEKGIFNNYRPISLLPALSKIMEKNVANKLINYFNRYDLFYKHQYGFRKKHSTIHPIIHFLNHIANQKDISSKNITAAMFLDLSKAFDTISHKILLEKIGILWN